jgi:4'-phosphopantetheinyl transferase EntD
MYAIAYFVCLFF